MLLESQQPKLKPGHFYQRLGYDMFGNELPHLRKIVKYDGKYAQAANVKLRAVPTFDQLNQVVQPIAPGQPEGIAWTWWDTQTYTSGTTTQLDFFQGINADKTLGNMQAQGQLPNPMYFMLYHLQVYIDMGPSGLAVAAAITTPLLGAINDTRNLVQGSISLSVAQKTYYESKISMCPAGIGPSEKGLAIAGTYTATDGDQVQTANNGVADIRARNCFWGTIVIPPTQNFLVRMNWSAALTLHNGNTPIVTHMDGYLFRRAL